MLLNVSKYLLTLTVFTLFLWACSKEGSLEKGSGSQVSRLSSKNPDALSDSIKVWHGIRTTGTLPAPSGNTLKLETPAEPYIKAFAGRYAIFKPEILSGDVKGYHVGVSGAKQYFKVDYSKPRNTGRVNNIKPAKSASPLARLNGTREVEDSFIVIQLPPSLTVPDTICVNYVAYDAFGNISQPQTVCIIVEKLGGDANSAWLHGTWQFNSLYDNTFYDTIVVNKWSTYFNGRSLYCSYDAPNNEYWVRDAPDSANHAILAKDSVFRKYANMVFQADGTAMQNWHEAYKTVSTSFSTCSTLVYDHEEVEDVNQTGGWNFNSTTNKLLIIVEMEKDGTTVGLIEEHDVLKMGDSHFVILDKQDPSNVFYIKMRKI